MNKKFILIISLIIIIAVSVAIVVYTLIKQSAPVTFPSNNQTSKTPVPPKNELKTSPRELSSNEARIFSGKTINLDASCNANPTSIQTFQTSTILLRNFANIDLKISIGTKAYSIAHDSDKPVPLSEIKSITSTLPVTCNGKNSATIFIK